MEGSEGRRVHRDASISKSCRICTQRQSYILHVQKLSVIILTCNFYNIFSASFLHEFVFAYIYTYRAMIFIVSRNNSKFHFISHREFES